MKVYTLTLLISELRQNPFEIYYQVAMNTLGGQLVLFFFFFGIRHSGTLSLECSIAQP